MCSICQNPSAKPLSDTALAHLSPLRSFHRTQKASSRCDSHEDDGDALDHWSIIKWSESLDISKLLSEQLCRPLHERLKEPALVDRSVAELEYVRALGEMCDASQLQQLLAPAFHKVAEILKDAGKKLNQSSATSAELSNKAMKSALPPQTP